MSLLEHLEANRRIVARLARETPWVIGYPLNIRTEENERLRNESIARLLEGDEPQ